MKIWNRKTGIVTLALVFGLIATTPALAFGPPPHGGQGGPFGLKMLMELDLSADQRAQVADLIRTQRGEREEHRAQVRTTREAFRSAMETTPFNEDNVRAAFQQMVPAMEDGAIQGARFLSAFRQILTDEQLAAIDTRREQGKEKRREHHQLQERMLDTWLGMNDQ